MTHVNLWGTFLAFHLNFIAQYNNNLSPQLILHVESAMTVLETAGVPVTGGPPMLMSNAVYLNSIIYKFKDRRTSSDWNSSSLQDWMTNTPTD